MNRSPITEEEVLVARTLFQLQNWLASSVSAFLAAIFAVMPRSWFDSLSVAHSIKYVLGMWPKLATDYTFLSAANPSFAAKYVVFNTIVGGIFLLANLALGVSLAVVLARNPRPLPMFFRKFISFFLGLLTVLFLGWWIILKPTPFMDSFGFSTRYPKNELVFFYIVGFWACLQLFWTNLFVRIVKLMPLLSSK